MTAIVSGGGYSPPNLSQLFSKLDTNQDGSVDKSEFVTGAGGSQDSSSTDSSAAAQLFSLFDSDQDGKLTKGELQTGFQKLGDSLKSLLIGQQSVDGTSGQGHRGGPPNADQLFSSLDTDQSGSVDKAEFLKGPADAPQGSGPSEAEKEQLFTQFDTNQDGSLSKSELETGFQSLAQNGPGGGQGVPPGPPPGGSGGPGGSGSSQSDSLSQLIKLLESTSSSSSSSSDSSSSDSSTTSGVQSASIASLLQTFLQQQQTTITASTQVTA
jgi:Ca2+-binding EF-hand superfamily protein